MDIPDLSTVISDLNAVVDLGNRLLKDGWSMPVVVLVLLVVLSPKIIKVFCGYARGSKNIVELFDRGENLTRRIKKVRKRMEDVRQCPGADVSAWRREESFLVHRRNMLVTKKQFFRYLRNGGGAHANDDGEDGRPFALRGIGLLISSFLVTVFFGSVVWLALYFAAVRQSNSSGESYSEPAAYFWGPLLAMLVSLGLFLLVGCLWRRGLIKYAFKRYLLLPSVEQDMRLFESPDGTFEPEDVKDFHGVREEFREEMRARVSFGHRPLGRYLMHVLIPLIGGIALGSFVPSIPIVVFLYTVWPRLEPWSDWIVGVPEVVGVVLLFLTVLWMDKVPPVMSAQEAARAAKS